jgi:hypothetical protein
MTFCSIKKKKIIYEFMIPIHLAPLGYIPVIHQNFRQKNNMDINNENQNKNNNNNNYLILDNDDININFERIYPFQTDTDNSNNKSNKSSTVNSSSSSSIITMRDFKSLILTALIFLTIFAWVDVLAAYYKNYYYYYGRDVKLQRKKKLLLHYGDDTTNNIAGMIPPDILHRLPKHQIHSSSLDTNDDNDDTAISIDKKNANMKLGYAIILSGISFFIWILFDKVLK